jgi:tRNA(fMet)-specific endonuclease VapC
MASFILDTNHVSAALRPVSRLRERLSQAMRSGHRMGTCIPVLCEVEAGLRCLQRPQPYRQALDHLLTRVRLWPLDRRVASTYGIVDQELRGRGRALSQVDMILASLGIVMSATLLTSDADFDALPSVRVENWIE